MNEILRSSVYIISYTGDDFKIHQKYRDYLHEAENVVSAPKGDQTNLTKKNCSNECNKTKFILIFPFLFTYIFHKLLSP